MKKAPLGYIIPERGRGRQVHDNAVSYSVTVSYRRVMLQESRGFPRLHSEAEPTLPRREV